MSKTFGSPQLPTPPLYLSQPCICIILPFSEYYVNRIQKIARLGAGQENVAVQRIHILFYAEQTT